MSYLRQGAPFERCTKHQCGVFHLPRMQGKVFGPDGQFRWVLDRKGDETRIGPQPQHGGEDETRTASASCPTVGVLVDNMGSTYALRLGINTIGRSAASSTATIQIATNDRTMSRSHAVIEVSHAGGKTIHILRNGANKNPSYMNGVLIGQQDQLVLNNGDRIKMGSTELTFKK